MFCNDRPRREIEQGEDGNQENEANNDNSCFDTKDAAGSFLIR